jgi:NtrC-family two-component system response regulator AlgB
MRVLIIDDETNIRRTTEIVLQTMGHETIQATNGYEARKALEKTGIDVAFLDLKLGTENGLELLPQLLQIAPRLSIIVYTAYASFETAVEAVKIGAFDYIPKPFTPEQVRQIFQKIEKFRKLEGRVAELESRLSNEEPELEFTTREPAMQQTFDLAAKAAASNATILIMGESGTGKNVLARWIHRQSTVRDHPIVTVNCPSLSRELLESELFGHVKGAFTGAVNDTHGKVAAANNGTLFLDEIGELPLEIQPKLLRLLQDREYERVGETKTRRATVRVISATNRNLEEAVKEGTFREDLYYRLNVMSLIMPPLRERPADLLPLAENYLSFFAAQMRKKIKGFSSDATKLLQQHAWPGNLRELRNTIERAAILASQNQIEAVDFPDRVQRVENSSAELGAMISLEDLEKEHIRRILAKISHLDEAAKILGIDPATLYRKRKKFGLE